MLSVIIPVKNMEKYIEKCISSIFKQKEIKFNINIIVCDFGSTDNTIKKANQFKGNNNINIEIYENTGKDVVEARNYGIKMAKTKYLSFIDADDWIDEHYYYNTIKYIEDNKLDMVYTNFINKDERTNKEEKVANEKIEIIDSCYDEYINLMQLIIFNKINCEAWNKIYKAEFFNKNNIYFDNTFGVNGEDLLLNLLIVNCKPKCGFIENINYYHLVREKSLGKLFNKEVSRRFIYIVEKLEHIFNKSKYEKKYINILFINLMLQNLNQCQNFDEFKMCKNNYIKSKYYLQSIIINIFSTITDLKRKIVCLMLILNMNKIIYEIRRKR